MLSISILTTLALSSAAHGFALRAFPTGFATQPGAIVAGPDKTVWFTESNGIDRIDAAGHVRRFPVNSAPGHLAAGPAGDVWFIDADARAIGHLMPDGRVREFLTHTLPTDLAMGTDGNVWFIATDGLAGRVTPAGTVTRFSISASKVGKPTSIAAGPDGRVWIAQHRRVDAIDARGAITRYALRTTDDVQLVAAGPDDRVWLATDDGVVLQMTTGGRIAWRGTLEDAPAAMAAGPDGHMWMSLPVANQIIDVTTAGKVAEHGPGSRAGTPWAGFTAQGLALARDGHLWVVEPLQERVARITPGPACAVPDVVGMREVAARTALRAGGCSVVVARGGSATTVKAQSVMAGRVEKAGTVITVTLGAPPKECRLPLDADAVLETPAALVAERHLSLDDGQGGSSMIAIGCAQSSGQVITLGRSRSSFELFTVDDVRLAGTQVAFTTTDLDDFGVATAAIETRDLARDGPTTIVATLDPAAIVSDFALAPGGAIAWIDRIDPSHVLETLHVWVRGVTTTIAVAAPGRELTDLALSASTVYWTTAQEEMNAPVPG